VIGPSAQSVGTRGVWVSDTLGERVAESHVPTEGHVSNFVRIAWRFANHIAVG
jgi:hypothetical protein